MIFFQVCLAGLLLLTLVTSLNRDVHGCAAKPPGDIVSVLITLAATATVAWVYFRAGAFSQIF